MSIENTLDAMKAAQANGQLEKAYTVATGLVYYDLQPVALNLYPVLTPLRNEIPRVMGGGDTATRWKAITAINSTSVRPGVAEGKRGATITTVVTPKTAAYIPFGFEDSVTFEADLAAVNYDDAKAKAALGLLRSTMIAEELHLFAGNGSLALGTTPTPTVSNAGTGGTIASATYNVACVALTVQGYLASSLTNGVVQAVSKTNVDGSTDSMSGGAAKVSATASTSTTGSTSTISAYVTAVEGAVAYAWFAGTSGNEKLEAITKINSVKLTALAGTHQALSALGSTDYSYDATYDYDGLLYLATAANGATVKTLATGTEGTGTALTSDGAGGITEINDVLQSMWDSYKLGPTDMLCSAQDLVNITKLVVANGGAPLFRFNLDASQGQQIGLSAGTVVGSYLNPITQSLIRVRVHPNAVQGTILMYSTSIPYPLSGVGNVMQVKCRRDYYQIEWPLVTRAYQYGVYLDSVLQHYAPFSMAVIKNIKA